MQSTHSHVEKKNYVLDKNHYILGAYETGTDPLGYFMITVAPQQFSPTTNNTQLEYDGAVAESVTNLMVADIFEIDTGFTQKNYWLNWVEDAAPVDTRENCVECSSPRPAMLTVPSLFPDNETYCMLHLHMTENL